MNKKKFHLAGEVALLIVLLINSLGVDLMSKSGFGISTISSVPLVFNIAFPVFSFGTWNYIFQTLLVITLMILKRSFCPGYLFSFVVGIGFGKMIDVHNAWIQALPNSLPLHTIYFLAGFLLVCFGICLANNCMLPIIPTDIFPRDLSGIVKKNNKIVKTTFDLTCLTTTVVLSPYNPPRILRHRNRHCLLCIPDWKNRFRHPEFSWKTRGILPCNWEEESCS